MQVKFHQENKSKPVMVTTSVRNHPDLTQTRNATKEDKVAWSKAWAAFEADR